jgi:glycosyltransferase involved in cell wall biosynthesis
MKVSIITVAYNSATTIAETIDTVLSQDYPHIEYIVIDGLSEDGTQDIVKSYGKKITQFISERDSGLYDAMNKGIALATGEIIGILNSDDLYENNYVITSVVNEFQRTNADAVFGDLYYFKSDNPDKPVRYYRGKNFSKKKIEIGILPPHPTFFVKRSVYDEFGKFDLQFKLASDFDLMTRFLYVHNISFSYLPVTMVRMRLGGISTGNWKRIIQINKEDLKSCKKNNVRTNFIMFHIKYLIKVLHIRSPKDLFFHK